LSHSYSNPFAASTTPANSYSTPRKILTEYIHELNGELNSEYGANCRVRDFLIRLFRDHDAELIKTISPETIMSFNEKHHKIYSMWCGVLVCIELLESYSPVHAATSKNRIVAYLNPQMCRTIDKYHYAFNFTCKKLGAMVELPKEKYIFWAMSQGA
jgi:hypothetical protein